MIPPKPSTSPPKATTARSDDPGVVCVSVRRDGQFWRFACDGAGVRELFERLAELADSDAPLSWEDAELIAAQVLSHQSPDRGQPGPEYDR
jgi:hypothetical protein